MAIYTIGYEGISIDSFLSLLHQHDIETVVDVRELPLSRKRGFSKTALALTLSLSGMDYTHLPALGCPKPIRDRYRMDRDWSRYKTGFLKYLNSQGDALAELYSLALGSNCALVCFEADYNYCHRSMVADALHQLSGMRVSHIQAPNIRATAPAGLSPAFA